MTGRTRALAATGAACLVLALAAPRRAWAHDLRPGVLSLAEVDRGSFALRLVAPVDGRGDDVELTIELPPGCARDGDRLRCPGGLTGALAVRGMRGDSMRTILRLTRLDGSRGEWILAADSPVATLEAPPPGGWAWIRIGVDHILGGIDHLAFLLGLLLLLGLGLRPVVDRRLLVTISTFTVAHSLTLALAVTGVVELGGAAVEACIAASVLLVAREATHRQPTATRRWPWLAAGCFGLVHGLGFASALSAQGLPRAALVESLALFNVGVELGQLAVVSAVVLCAQLGARLATGRAALAARLHAAACYGLGGCAAWWLAERVLVVASGAR